MKVKLIVCILLTTVIAIAVRAQNEPSTLLSDNSIKKIGIMVAPSIGYTNMDRANVALLNIRGGVVLADKLTIGGYYSASINEFVPASEIAPDVYTQAQELCD